MAPMTPAAGSEPLGGEERCPACYDSFSGPWCDNCDQWPCRCLAAPPSSVVERGGLEGVDMFATRLQETGEATVYPGDEETVIAALRAIGAEVFTVALLPSSSVGASSETAGLPVRRRLDSMFLTIAELEDGYRNRDHEVSAIDLLALFQEAKNVRAALAATPVAATPEKANLDLATQPIADETTEEEKTDAG